MAKTAKQSNLKMGRGSEWTFFQRWHIDGQHLHETVLNIINRGNVNQNHTCLLEWLLSKRQEIMCWQGCGEKGTLVHCWWDFKLVQPLWKISAWSFLKKLNIKLPYDPAILSLGIYPKKTEILIGEDICTPMFIAALFRWTVDGPWGHCDEANKSEKDKYHMISLILEYLKRKKKNKQTRFGVARGRGWGWQNGWRVPKGTNFQ